jgi:succinate dehydrogenase / fumarate reductase membrane anchor subunit
MIGSTLFYAQRLTAVFLLGYSLWLLSFFILNQPLEYNIWVFFTDQMHFLILTSMMAIIIAIHAFIGLWTIGTDYFTSRTLGFLSPAIAKYADVIRGLYSLLFTIWGISIIFFILLIIWS